MKIVFAEDNDITLLSFRKELLDVLIENGHEIFLVGEFSKKVIDEYQNKTTIRNLNLDLKSTSLFKNLKVKKTYKTLIDEIDPDLILSFTIKPNIYCNLNKHRAFSIANITGLGTAFDKRFIRKVVIHLYKKAFKNVDVVMFQNSSIKKTFFENKICVNDYRLIPGSGVNEERFSNVPFKEHEGTRFLFPSRFIKEKGFNLLIESIPLIQKEYPNASFKFLGKSNPESDKLIKKLTNLHVNNVEFISFTDNIQKYYEWSDFIVSPSFYNEGMSNVLLEALAMGRPIITTNDNPGCKEILQEEINGFGVKSNNLESLLKALEKACKTSIEQRRLMAKQGRECVIKNFNRKDTIKTYLNIINKI